MHPLLTVNNLSIRFQDGNLAVDDISFAVADGEAVAVVGESGSGKSVTALSLTRLLPAPPACTVSGGIVWRGKDLLAADHAAIRRARGKEIAYIFQEPSTSLNPVFSIGYQIAEAIKLHRPEIKDVNAEIARVLELVGIRNAGQRQRDYP
ncbi:MAG: ATP-binding cassette domain-containing protein, partial [Verrucomicrobiales bacterium]|nr:ATP-binding cassette domain-containing protein [Verrucomicrobiales bacterium]